MPCSTGATRLNSSPLRVAIDARLESGTVGGVEQFVVGLASGLSQLKETDDVYYFLTQDADIGWIEPYLEGNCALLQTEMRESAARWKQRLRTLPQLRRAWNTVTPLAGKRTIRIPRSDGTIERAGIDVMHFTRQGAFLTAVPSIYQPWDLQHRHLPEFFTPRERLSRDVLLRAFCEQATTVAVPSGWGKEDLVTTFDVQANKIEVVPLAPPTAAYGVPSSAEVAKVRGRLDLPEAFALYPAQTWPHKNHVLLLEALATLRARRDVIVPLVCTGHLNQFSAEVRAKADSLGIADQVRFLGFVSTLELQCLYRLCRCLVFPSKFEGWGFPISEAFYARVPVASSNVTCLPQQAGDAAVLFDPEDTEAIATAVQRIWLDTALRQKLVKRGRQRIDCWTWARTASLFRANYRRLGGRPLDDHDHLALERSAAEATSGPRG